MKPNSDTPRYLIRWNFSDDQNLLRDVVTCSHRLENLPMFTDTGLIEILDRYPRSAIRVTSAGTNPAHPSEWEVGQIGAHSGAELFSMIRRGRLCVRLQNLVDHHTVLSHLVRRLGKEMMECQVRLWAQAHNGDLVITSPDTLQYLSFDHVPSIHWQLRGSQLVRCYPRRSPFLPTRNLEDHITTGSDQPLYFEPDFDRHSQAHSLPAGGVLGLPQHTPYRVVNGSSVSVSLVTRYCSAQTRRINQLRVGTRILRKVGVSTPCPFRDFFELDALGHRERLRVKATCLLGGLASRMIPRSANTKPSFAVEPDSRQCRSEERIPMIVSQDDCPLYPSLPWEALPTLSTMLEN